MAMRILAPNEWTQAAPAAGALGGKLDVVARVAAMVLLVAVVARPWLVETSAPDDAPAEPAKSDAAKPLTGTGREIFLAGYIGAPFYYRSNVHMTRPDQTDVTLKRLGWDGDAMHFPIDGGIRSVEWWNSTGFMVDFLHNKAVARLGKGAHGRKLSNPVVEEVEASGTIKGQPAPQRMKLTDMFERFEFTHGHNMLFFTPMLRLGAITPRVRPYVGVGAGFALPHVEVWSPGQARDAHQRVSIWRAGSPDGRRAGAAHRQAFVLPGIQVFVCLDFRCADGRSVLAELQHAR